MQLCEHRQHWPVVTDDAFFSGAIRVLQPKKGYRAGIDAVLLAASLEVGEQDGAQVLDLGAGVGVAGLAVATRCSNAIVTLVEKQPILAEIASANILRNQFQNRVSVCKVDLLSPKSIDVLGSGSFDHVISNPPYYDDHAIQHSENVFKAQSNAMPRGALQRWIKFMAIATKPGGSATMMHLAERLGSILQYFSLHFGGISVQFFYPRENEKASRIIVRGIRGSKAPMQINPGIILHTPQHEFCSDITQVLRHPMALPI